jgi:2-polyprenyl-6-methoxyphenol hydroxylase-like FAD-dependent oxidoreductase
MKASVCSAAFCDPARENRCKVAGGPARSGGSQPALHGTGPAGRTVFFLTAVPTGATRLVAGRVALIGDAAHVSSPMTGSGFHYSLLDVLSLRQALAGIAGGEAVAAALTQFEHARLADDRQLALYGRRWSRDYLANL